jgi:hypothetical protein
VADLAYLLARLPPLSPRDETRPLGADEFLALLNDPHYRGWCSAILAWLALANREASQLQLPPPFPDADEWPESGGSPGDSWVEYFNVLTHLGAPDLIRTWAREDQTLIAYRSRCRGTESSLYRRTVPRADLAALVESQPTSLDAARALDRRILRFEFSRLDQYLLGEAPDSVLRLYAYAIRLLLLARAGITVEVAHAA